jgi:hypothetical protein
VIFVRYVRSFLNFWYDFFIGDAWELAAGTVLILFLVAIMAKALDGVIWLLFPIGVFAVLTASVILYSRKHSH